MDAALLTELLAEPYFANVPPKSTGRDLFDIAWLDIHLAGCTATVHDVMTTLADDALAISGATGRSAGAGFVTKRHARSEEM